MRYTPNRYSPLTDYCGSTWGVVIILWDASRFTALYNYHSKKKPGTWLLVADSQVPLSCRSGAQLYMSFSLWHWLALVLFFFSSTLGKEKAWRIICFI